ncbi:MAG: carboxypeptidase regulatory-like domain-containing protein [Thermoprotei archaeon]|nr:carboxypeptidase regulatory-like domain-containing protein [Thermoprotei archaeon]
MSGYKSLRGLVLIATIFAAFLLLAAVPTAVQAQGPLIYGENGEWITVKVRLVSNAMKNGTLFDRKYVTNATAAAEATITTLHDAKILFAIYNISYSQGLPLGGLEDIVDSDFPLVVGEFETDEEGWFNFTIWAPLHKADETQWVYPNSMYNMTIILMKEVNGMVLNYTIYNWTLTGYELVRALNESALPCHVYSAIFHVMTQNDVDVSDAKVEIYQLVDSGEYAKLWEDMTDTDGMTGFFNFSLLYVPSLTFEVNKTLHLDECVKVADDYAFNVTVTWRDITVLEEEMIDAEDIKGAPNITKDLKVLLMKAVVQLKYLDPEDKAWEDFYPHTSPATVMLKDPDTGNVFAENRTTYYGYVEFIVPNKTLTVVATYYGVEVNVTSANLFMNPALNINCTIVPVSIQLLDSTIDKSPLHLPSDKVTVIVELPNKVQLVVHPIDEAYVPLPPYWYSSASGIPYAYYYYYEGIFRPWGLLPVPYTTEDVKTGEITVTVMYNDLKIAEETITLNFTKYVEEVTFDVSKIETSVYRAVIKVCNLAGDVLSERTATFELLTEEGKMVSGGLMTDGTIRYYGPGGIFKLTVTWKGETVELVEPSRIEITNETGMTSVKVAVIPSLRYQLVRWDEDKGVEGINATLIYPHGFQEEWNTTDADGYVYFSNVPAGVSATLLAYTNSSRGVPQWATPGVRPGMDDSILVANFTTPEFPAKVALSYSNKTWIYTPTFKAVARDGTVLEKLTVTVYDEDHEYPVVLLLNGAPVTYTEVVETLENGAHVIKKYLYVYNFSVIETEDEGVFIIESTQGNNSRLLLPGGKYNFTVFYGGVPVNVTINLELPKPTETTEVVFKTTVTPTKIYTFSEDGKYLIPGVNVTLSFGPALNYTYMDSFRTLNVSNIPNWDEYLLDTPRHSYNVSAVSGSEGYALFYLPSWTNSSILGLSTWDDVTVDTEPISSGGLFALVKLAIGTDYDTPGVSVESFEMAPAEYFEGCSELTYMNITEAYNATLGFAWNLTKAEGTFYAAKAKVLNAAGVPMAGYNVTLMIPDGTVVSWNTTDSDGIVTFTAVPGVTVTLPDGRVNKTAKLLFWKSSVVEGNEHVYECSMKAVKELSETLKVEELTGGKVFVPLLKVVETNVDPDTVTEMKWDQIFLTVVDANGKPLKDAVVLLKSGATGGFVSLNVTNAYGKTWLYLGGVYVGDTFINETTLLSRGFDAIVYWSKPVFAASGKPIEIAVQPLEVGFGKRTFVVSTRVYTVTLKFITDTGRPVKGLSVVVKWPEGVTVGRGTTDENGLFVVGAQVPVGKYDVEATYKGVKVYSGIVTVDSNIDEKTWSAGKGLLRCAIYDIAIKVLTPSGTPMTHAAVTITSEPTGESWSATLNGEGKTTVTDVVGGRLTITIDSWKNVEIKKTADTLTITKSGEYELTFSGIGVLRVTVLGERGTGIGPSTVEIRMGNTVVEKGITDENGIYVTELPAGSYTVNVDFKGRTASGTVTVGEGGALSELSLSVPVYMVLAGYPLSYGEFVGIIAGIIIAVIVITIALHEYSIWRRRRIARAVAPARAPA